MSTHLPVRRPRVLFLCTHNSARSQLAEALLWAAAGDTIEEASAGAEPRTEVDPMTFEVLDELGIDRRAHGPKGFESVMHTTWDLVITFCDHARDVCPVLPGHPTFAHWSIEDPCRALGLPAERKAVFQKVVSLLQGRISEPLRLRWELYPGDRENPTTTL